MRMPPSRLLYSRTCLHLMSLVLGLLAGSGTAAFAQSPGAPRMRPNLESNIERPLRYRPEGTDFVIENSPECFNRPLYGGGTAFRVDAGDRPEFAFYLPGRGGVLRLGLRSSRGTRWLDETAHIVARYRAGSMVYEIADPSLGSGSLTLHVVPFFITEGLMLKIELANTQEPIELLWALGGSDGQRGSRDVDIGTEREPVSRWWQLKPEQCRDNRFQIDRHIFSFHGKKGLLFGIAPEGASHAVADATQWADLSALAQSAGARTEFPVVLGRLKLPVNSPAVYLAVQRLTQKTDDSGELSTYREVRTERGGNKKPDAAQLPPAFTARDLPRLFSEAELYRSQSLATKLVVDTPDPFLNAAVAALNLAGDGVWDSVTGTVMHGAVAWRSKLLGWRGPYLNDALGYHDRALSHINYWAGMQNTQPIPEALPPADASANLARNEAALHSNGDLSNSHYDMNLVYIDAVFRHLLWTGDLDLARKLWPMIERHLAWERRLFRRSYGPKALPLYEGYCCIWASDDVAYSGGGATHSSAYNYYHNKLAARLAKQLGVDASLYEREAAQILEGMRQELWLPKLGWYAEWRDWLGARAAHPSPALWTFYHSVDSESTSPFEAWQMTRFIDTQIARIPLRGQGVPSGDFFTLPTSNWLPYAWSTNNVVMSEVAHTALGYWQSGRPNEAWRLYKGAILDSMYLGLCPGNAGMCTQFDVARREAQRDFADSVGMMSRALVEGLFGIHPDALAGELFVRPSLPADWNQAALNHRSVGFRFERQGDEEHYLIEGRFARPQSLRLQVPVLRSEIASVTINGSSAAWRLIEDSVGTPRIELLSPATTRHDLRIRYRGERLLANSSPASTQLAIGASTQLDFAPARICGLQDPQQALAPKQLSDHTVALTAVGVLGHRSAFIRLSQGQISWWQPVHVEICAPLAVLDRPEKPDAFHFTVTNHTDAPFAGTAKLLNGPAVESRPLALAAHSGETVLMPSTGFLPGTQRLLVDSREGASTGFLVSNWLIPSVPSGTRFETVDLTRLFNDRVTQIYKNEYLSPRSPFCSLSIPKQGIGSWCRIKQTAEIDDSGLRKIASEHEGRFTLPCGIPFATPGRETEKNILFTSLWDNYPKEAQVPLSGKASHVYLLMAGSTNSMQSRFDNGEVIVTYTDGSSERLALENPTTWWPLEEDYLTDDFAFRRPESVPPRVDLKTGAVRIYSPADFRGRGGKIPGGAATVLDLPLRPDKELRSLTVRTLANEVIIGLMSLTLVR